MSAERSPAEIWSVLQEQARQDDAVEAAVAAAMAMSDDELDASLKDAGFSVADLETAAIELARPAPNEPAQAVDAYAAPTPIERGRRRRPSMLVLAAAATTAVVGGGLLYTALRAPVPAPAPTPTTEPSVAPVQSALPDLVAAADLRGRARAALAAGYKGQCLDLLDQARSIDPSGDEAADVVALREKATEPEGPPKPSLK